MHTNEVAAPESLRAPGTANARVADAMHPGVITCSADTPLREVAGLMASKHVHCLVVPRDEPSSTWGMISGLDLVGAVADNVDERTAGELAASESVAVSAHESLERATQLMIEHQVEHLIVVGDDEHRPVGVLSTLDIAREMARGEV